MTPRRDPLQGTMTPRERASMDALIREEIAKRRALADKLDRGGLTGRAARLREVADKMERAAAADPSGRPSPSA